MLGWGSPFAVNNSLHCGGYATGGCGVSRLVPKLSLVKSALILAISQAIACVQLPHRLPVHVPRIGIGDAELQSVVLSYAIDNPSPKRETFPTAAAVTLKSGTK